jgi:mono/diheme cytochrome c family protein
VAIFSDVNSTVKPFLASAFLPLALLAAARPASAAGDRTADFEEKVLPLLRAHCFKCHSHQADRIKGGLVLDSVAAMLAGGDTGPAIVPGHPEKSLLIAAVNHAGELKMPAKADKLAAADIAILEQWVKDGAPAPQTGQTSSTLPNGPAKRAGKITDEDRAWWAYQRLKPVPVPPAPKSAAARNEIDHFIFSRLEADGLKPAAEAARATLARRLYFDLWGLPPAPEDVEGFVRDAAPDAYERLVDRLLASPRYGERWARYWLDLVRYADSDGYRLDSYRPHAWRYRDYVIHAFNTDKPYDRFVQEQLAGDELFPGDPEATIATGYLVHWIYEYNNRDAEGQWKNILIDITDTTGDVFLGAGMQCARCHDHKFDPILQKDYYALQAFFGALIAPEETVVATEAQRRDHARRAKAWEQKTAAIRSQITAIESKHLQSAQRSAVEKFPEEVQAMLAKPVAERTPYEHQVAELAYRQVTYEYARLDSRLKGEEKEKYLALKKQLSEFDELKPEPLPVAMAAFDLGPKAPPITIPKKGDAPVEPAFLTVLGEAPPAIRPLANSTGRRSALALWLTQPDHPFTARVLVNRLWQQHFGRGLAANASDFGKLGEKPSHPELLDWLANRFVADGWSLKKLHRLIVTSATYRQSAHSEIADAAKLKDPENRLLWRANTRRLEAEQIRDAVYAVTGELDLQAGGPGSNFSEPRRSIYCKFMRNTRDPLIDAFDAPFWFQSASSRDTTTTPVQSLLLINSQFMLQRARALAQRLEQEGSMDEAATVRRAYQLTFGRPPSPAETEAALQFLRDQAGRIDPERAGSAKAAFLYDKIPYRDGQAAIMSLEGGQNRFEVPDHEALPNGDFAIESYVLLRSVDESAGVRTIAAKWSGKGGAPGWGFGVTGKKSRRKPQTLVLQIYGRKLDGSFGEEALFSDQNIQLNRPYYLAVSVKLARDGRPGEAAFYVKDLSNDDEPLLIARLPHQVTGGFENKEPFTIGGRAPEKGGKFDGLIDDVRLSNAALGVDQLLFTNEGINKNTVGYWQFESKPDVFRDATGHGLDIKPTATFTKARVDTRKAALQDFCHVLLNANEFLYVE